MNDEEIHKVAMISFSHYETDPRVKREAISLRKEGYHIHVISLRKKEELKNIEYDGIFIRKKMRWVTRLSGGSKLRYLIGFTLFVCVSNLELFRYYLTGTKFQVIHIHNPPDHLLFAGLPFKVLSRSKIIVDRHEPFAEQIISNLGLTKKSILFKLLKIYEKIVNYFADVILVINNPDKEHMKTLLPKKRIYEIRNSLDTSNLVAISKEKNSKKEDSFKILYQGFISRRRDIDTILYAINDLNDKIPNLEFTLVGHGDYIKEMLRVIEDLELDKYVNFKGFVDKNSLMEEIWITDLCLLTAKDLPIYQMYTPNKLFEYMYYNKPIIAADLPHLRFLSEDSCFFYTPGNFQSLSQEILFVYKNKEEVNQKISIMPEVLAKNVWEIDESRLIECYRDLLNIRI